MNIPMLVFFRIQGKINTRNKIIDYVLKIVLDYKLFYFSFGFV